MVFARKQSVCWLLIVAFLGSWALGTGAEAKTKAAKKTTVSVSRTSSSEPPVVVNFNPYPPMVVPVRIGLARRAVLSRVAVYAPGAVFVDGRPVFALQPQAVYFLMGGRIVEYGTNRAYCLPVDRRAEIAASDYRVWANNRWYRGVLEVISFGSTTTLVNLLDLEEYLLGVVPSEMPANWHPEALKSQAVAARSYAWAHVGRGSKWLASEGYDLVPDVRDQCYKGLGQEANSTFWAVKLTRGIILKDSGRVKPGFYRATVGDPFENLNIRKQMVPSALLEKMTGVPKIVGVTVKQWDPLGNAHSIQVMGQKKSREVYGVALAKMLGLSTAGILDVQETGNVWVFTYRGPGNGARGLSQTGAHMLGKNGWRWDQILTQYYQDPDGKLRLDYVDNYRPMAMPVSIAPPPETASKPPRATDTSSSTSEDSGEGGL